MTNTSHAHRRAVPTASAPRGHAAPATVPPLRHLVVARRLSIGAAAAAVVVVAGLVVAVSLLAGGALPWVVGAVLGVAVLGALALGIHAGGHGLLLPLPVLVLAAAWGIAVSAGSWSSPVAWVLAVLAFLSALAAAALVMPAIAQRNVPGPPVGGAALVGAQGVALSPLTPSGVARVNNETWTAESISGPLAAGAPVHVAKVEGLRLLVWSEAGTVPGPDEVELSLQPKEEP